MIIITPSCRPKRIEWILDNWKRQVKDSKDELVIVWNNCEFPIINKKYENVTMLRSKAGIGPAFDLGIKFAKQRGQKSWICFDDDDWYGKNALSIAKEELKNNDLVGRISRFHKTINNKIWLLKTNSNDITGFGFGTMASNVFDRPFDDGGSSWGVETRWIKRNENLKSKVIKEQHYIYCRWENLDHTTSISDEGYALGFEKAFDLGDAEFSICEEYNIKEKNFINFDYEKQLRDLTLSSVIFSKK